MSQSHKNCKIVDSNKCELETVECDCGFHFGIDATYLEQKGDVNIICPNCKRELFVPGFD